MPKIDYLGRIVIPKHLRDALKLEPETNCRIEQVGNTIVLSPIQECCAICGSVYIAVKGKIPLCKNCFDNIHDNDTE